MSRRLCVYLDFLEEHHKTQISAAAERLGFVPRFFSLNQFEEAKNYLQSCEVLFAHDPQLLRAAPASLKWYHCAFAGVDPYCADPILFANPACLLTNSSCYGVTIAEHVVMVTLMLLRQMPAYLRIAAERDWTNDLPIRSIQGSRFTLLGTGDIGTEIARRLNAMNAGRIIGVSRSGKAKPDFDEIYPVSRLAEILPETDVLIAALPATSETIGLMSREMLALLPQSAYFINVGRGTLPDQEALAELLRSGRLAGAALDVMVPEPLPRDHYLWDTPNLILTPHVSGNTTLALTRNAIVDLFCRNLEHYALARPLEGLVDRTAGY